MRSSLMTRAGVLISALFLSIAVSGCAAASDDDPTSSVAQELRGGNDHGGHGPHGYGPRGNHGPQDWHGRPHGRTHLEQPQGVYFADVSANGTGCPAGSWDVGISEDGETFTLRFSQYEATVEPGQARDVKDCKLDIKLKSPEGLSYSVASFYYQGYVFLEKEGMRARQVASYSFDGNRRENRADRNEVTGPLDDSYLFASELGPAQRAWSPCGTDDTLHIATRLVMRNDPQNSGSGYVNSATVDGSLTFNWKVHWRRCHH